MILRGKLYAESPIYRGNARKTLFTRDGDGKQRLVSLAGEIGGTAQSLMDAFIGQDRRGRNIGLLNQLWQRLYGQSMPDNLIKAVDCQLQKSSYPRDNFFDLRMGIKLDEDRWAAEANANYKYETLYRHSVFDLVISVNDSELQKNENTARLYYLLQELEAGRFWFGAAKSKGLGRCRLELDKSLPAPDAPPKTRSGANHLQISLTFDATNPVLVGWNWGKVDYDNVPAFSAIEGRLLVEAMRDLPNPIRQRLAMGIGGPILSPDDWKQKLADYLPRVTAIWLREQSFAETESLVLTDSGLKKLSKGKYGLSKKIIKQLQPLVDKPFSSEQAAEETVIEALEDKANMANRVLNAMERQTQTGHELDESTWQQVASGLGLNGQNLREEVAANLSDEADLTHVLRGAYRPVLPRLFEQVDQQVELIQSDAWVDTEIANREAHLQIKTMLLEGKISERQWGDRQAVPKGVSAAAWREFLDAHNRVRFRHMTHPRNLNKSIANDRNFIEFLNTYRNRTRQELAQPHNIDFRAGGPNNREISRKYGKHYDTVFMRMLSWAPSGQEQGAWEIYIPGSTIKGAFRKRATQVLKTLWGESNKTNDMLDTLFGRQGQRGLVFFSDAYLSDPHVPEKAWCSMDGVRMDPKTGQPLEQAKHDYLYAYGQQLVFNLRLDVQDISEQDVQAVSLLFHLLQDFQNGDIPIGGEKGVGMGWVQANVTGVTWLTSTPLGLSKDLFGEPELTQQGIWHQLHRTGEAAAKLVQPRASLEAQVKPTGEPPTAKDGFISHRAFGGYCGILSLETEILTPITVQESGEPSFTATVDGERINGWDFFSMSPPQAGHRSDDRLYALPSRSLKGMLRHLYAIASDSHSQASPNLNNLNPVDSLFGWVGQGQNQSIMGRLSVGFAYFDAPQLAWFKVPYPYGGWRYHNGQWEHSQGRSATKLVVADSWRLFAHAPLPPVAEQLSDFQPDSVQASYFRAILPGSKGRFNLRFWNLTEEEMQRLIWCLVLEDGLAHKMGKHRYLGFGSLRMKLLPDSFFIDWPNRYSAGDEQEWQLPVQVDQWLKPEVVSHYAELKQALDAQQL